MSGISIYACSNPQTVVTVEMTAVRSEVGLHNLTYYLEQLLLHNHHHHRRRPRRRLRLPHDVH